MILDLDIDNVAILDVYAEGFFEHCDCVFVFFTRDLYLHYLIIESRDWAFLVWVRSFARYDRDYSVCMSGGIMDLAVVVWFRYMLCALDVT